MSKMVRRLFLVLCWVVVCASGCDCGDTTLSQFPELVIEPPSLVYPVLTVGETNTQTVTLSSRGLPLSIFSIKVNTTGGTQAFTLLNADKLTFPLKLENDESVKLQIQYAPKEGGIARGEVVIQSDARNANEEGINTIRLIASELAGTLVANPNPVDFGGVTAGQSKTQSLTVTNNGQAKVVIKKAAFDDAGASQFVVTKAPNYPHELGPGASVNFTLQYTPNAPQAQTFLLLTLQDEDQPFRVRVVGKMSTPNLVAKPNPMVFAGVPKGQNKVQILTIENNGDSDVQITKMAFGDKSSPPFSLENAPALPLTIKAKSKAEIGIKFSPDKEEPATGEFVLSTTSQTQPTLKVVLEGNPRGCRLQTSPNELVFSNNSERELVILNAGSAPCEIKKVALVNGTSPGFTFAEPQKGSTLSPNQTRKVKVRFKATKKVPETGGILVESNDIATPQKTIPLRSQTGGGGPCELIVSPRTLLFGYVAIGQSKRLGVKLENKGQSDCTLQRAILQDNVGVFRLLTSLSAQGIPIQAGQSILLEVSFTPVNQQKVQGKLNLTSTDPKLPNVSISLSGYSGEQCLRAEPSPLNVGTIKKGCRSPNREVVVYNTCTTSVTVNQIRMGQGASPEFSVQSNVGLPRTLQAGQSMTFSVRYKPNDLGPDQATVDIVNSSPITPVSHVVLGEGISTNEVKDVFQQASKGEMDVLFVIDDSNSMNDKQQNLAKNLQSFLQFATQLQADFQIAVTTTDVDCRPGGRYTPVNGICKRPPRPDIPLAGCFRGTPKVLTPQTPDLLTKFSQNVKVGLRGSGNEQGIHASYLALQPDRLKGCNKGFLRNNATLSIIYVADEPDSSPLNNSDYVKFFLSLKNNKPDQVRVSSVVGPTPNGCIVNGFKVKAAPNYLDMAKQLKGVQANICASNWASTLSQLGSLTFGLKSEFFLSQPAEAGSIQVKVNGTLIPQGNQGWNYNNSNMSITFSKAGIPQPGATIEVSYKAKCLQ